MKYSLYLVLLNALLVGCESSSKASGDFPLDEISFSSNATINPITKQGTFQIGSLSVGINSPSGSSSTFIASAADTLSDGDRFTATTDVGRWSVPPSGRMIQGFEFADDSELLFGFYRNNSLRNGIVVTPNPRMIPVISASPTLLNRDSKLTEVTLQFPGLPENYELPNGIRLDIGTTNVVCYKDNEIVRNLFEAEDHPDTVPFDSFFGPNWSFTIQDTNADSLTQQLDAGDFIPRFTNNLVAGNLDSCTIDVVAFVLVDLRIIERDQSDISDIADIASNGKSPDNDFSFTIISEIFPITIDRSVFDDP